MYGKKILVVWLDEINPYLHPDDVNDELKNWYIDVDKLQGIRMAGKSADQTASSIANQIHLLKEDSTPSEQAKKKRTPPKNISVWRRLLIVAVAAVTVLAIAGVIWEISRPQSQSTGTVRSLGELDSVSVGDHFTLGNYRQGANGEVEPIEWRVLCVQDGKALVISDKLLDFVPFEESHEKNNLSWETSSLRWWMNHIFYDEAFSRGEKEVIASVTNRNEDNPEYGTESGNDTQDRIFALSIEEAEQYFSSNDDRAAYTTDYAHTKGEDFSDRSAFWWLRSAGIDGFYY